MPTSPLGPPARLPLSFELDGDTFTLPALDTRTFLDALALEPPGCWWALIPGELPEPEFARVWRRLRDRDDPLDIDELETVAEPVLTTALGCDVWAANRLAGAVYANWFVFDGWSYSRGLDPLSEPIGRILAACYYWRAGMCEKESEVTKLDHQIWAGPPAQRPSGVERDALPTWATGGREEAAFDAFTAMFGGAGPSRG